MKTYIISFDLNNIHCVDALWVRFKQYIDSPEGYKSGQYDLATEHKTTGQSIYFDDLDSNPPTGLQTRLVVVYDNNNKPIASGRIVFGTNTNNLEFNKNSIHQSHFLAYLLKKKANTAQVGEISRLSVLQHGKRKGYMELAALGLLKTAVNKDIRFIGIKAQAYLMKKYLRYGFKVVCKEPIASVLKPSIKEVLGACDLQQSYLQKYSNILLYNALTTFPFTLDIYVKFCFLFRKPENKRKLIKYSITGLTAALSLYAIYNSSLSTDSNHPGQALKK